MRFLKHTLILTLLCLGTACTGANQSVPALSAVPAASPTPIMTSAPTAVPTPMSIAEYILSVIPRCDEIEILDQPVKFVWPNVEQRLRDLEGSDWGYFSCPRPVAEVSAFYRERMLQPPYNLNETNWVDRSEGTLGIYYHPVRQNWTYMWVVPQPGDLQTSYVIVAQTASEVFEPECQSNQPQWSMSHAPSDFSLRVTLGSWALDLRRG